MKKRFFVLFITLITSTVYGQQGKTVINHRNNYVDSAIFYFKQSKTTHGIDSLVFAKGLKMMDSIPADDNTMKRFEKAAEEFKGIKPAFFYNQIQLGILQALYNAHEYYREIGYGKAIINTYDAVPNSYDRTLYLSTLDVLRIPFRVSDKLDEGFDFYTAKLKLNLQKKDSDAISMCYYVLGGFYLTNGLKDLSIYYYKKSIHFLNVNDTIYKGNATGREKWINNTGVVGMLNNTIGDYANGILYARRALHFGVHTARDSSILTYAYKNIAFAKAMLNEPDSVLMLLNEAIKSSSHSERSGYVSNCYEVMGIYYLKMGQLDSAAYCLETCNRLISEYSIAPNSPAGILNPNYYLALVRMKQNRFADAGELLQAEIPRLGNLREKIIDDYKLLVEVYLHLGNVKKANEAFIHYTALQEQLKEDERRNRKLSFETEQKITEAESTITNLTTEQKLVAQSRNYLIGIAILLLIIALVVYGRFRITRSQKVIIEKEKQRSDMLLLNILPSEVAEELKAKGSADAKQFADVTVMFTDFKNFTEISERLTPAELVAEIHHCFKAFDHIISKHNIEKIKTIGDSYMCAGGVPVSNHTHADDVVNAALEIQQFMYEHVQERKKANKEIFEIRIGIHTGAVVAGIVGIKKFAYDIWGDTVNIASRMESSGEVGKVNISGSTYELVKDKFTCHHRGKIQAKNKGDVDMYFVESLS